MSGKKEFVAVVLIAIASVALLFYTLTTYSPLVGQALHTIPLACQDTICAPIVITADLDHTYYQMQPITIPAEDTFTLEYIGEETMQGFLLMKIQREETFFSPAKQTVNPNRERDVRSYTDYVDYVMITQLEPVTLGPGIKYNLANYFNDASIYTTKGTYQIVIEVWSDSKPLLDANGNPVSVKIPFIV